MSFLVCILKAHLSLETKTSWLTWRVYPLCSDCSLVPRMPEFLSASRTFAIHWITKCLVDVVPLVMHSTWSFHGRLINWVQWNNITMTPALLHVCLLVSWYCFLILLLKLGSAVGSPVLSQLSSMTILYIYIYMYNDLSINYLLLESWWRGKERKSTKDEKENRCNIYHKYDCSSSCQSCVIEYPWGSVVPVFNFLFYDLIHAAFETMKMQFAFSFQLETSVTMAVW